jgi:hypothetical protein
VEAIIDIHNFDNTHYSDVTFLLTKYPDGAIAQYIVFAILSSCDEFGNGDVHLGIWSLPRYDAS